MKHSIFKQTIAVFFAAILLAAIVSGIFSFAYNSVMTSRGSSNYAQASASSAAHLVESIDFDELKKSDTSELYIRTRRMLRNICEGFELEYLYMYEANPSEENIRFIMTVASDDEKDALVARERGLGTVVPRTLTAQELSALRGESNNKAYVEHNSYGDVHSWFYPVYSDDGGVVALIGSDYRHDTLLWRAARGALVAILSMIAVLLLVFLTALIAMRKKIFVPIKRISNRMNDFVTDSGAKLEPLNITSGDEIQEIADSFEKMSADISDYLGDIERLTTERVQANVELEVASRIQRGIVPETTMLTASRYEVCAIAKPAKEVGGDFYDCFTRNDGSVCVVIGDVSGKGFAAAMFMVMAKTMLRDSLRSGLSPAKTLNSVNDALCKSNPEGMFATVFVGVLDLVSGTFSYANAGHTPPVIFGDETKFLEVDSGMALGLFEDTGIVDCSVKLKKDIGILIYTDGATEAVNAQKEFFGAERLLSAVRGASGAEHAVDILDDAVWSFADGAEQFDDYTALALYYKGGLKRTLALKPDLSALSEIKSAALGIAGGSPHGKKAVLACEEVFVNTVSYSRADDINVSFENRYGRLIVEFSDNGVPFNPLLSETDKPFEELDSGGMGIGLVKQLTDAVYYKRENDRNILTLEFELSED